MDNNSLISNIKRNRISRKLSQKEMAEKTGFNLKTYQRYETGETPVIKDDVLWAIAGVFGMTVEELVLGYAPSREAAKEVSDAREHYRMSISRERELYEEKLEQKDKEISILGKYVEDLRVALDKADQLQRMTQKRLDEALRDTKKND